jgi:hypothetical protein
MSQQSPCGGPDKVGVSQLPDHALSGRGQSVEFPFYFLLQVG